MELRKLLTWCGAIIIFAALMLLTPALSSASSYPSASPEQTPQGNFLSGFTLVPGSVTLIEQQYVLALFKNTEDDLYAVVLFNLNCASDGLDRCDVGEVLAYSLFDSQGVEKQLVKGPYGNGVSAYNPGRLTAPFRNEADLATVGKYLRNENSLPKGPSTMKDLA